MIKKFSVVFVVCFLALVLVLSGFAFTPLSGMSINNILLASSSVSNVLSDLQKDENFNSVNYPEDADDTSLKLIQIAESVEDELLVYVYQPSGAYLDLRASKIVISRTELPDDLFVYDLTYLNSSGTLYKYKVNDFSVSNESLRHYFITEIYRPFNSSIGDKESDDDTHITEVTYAVGKLYSAFTVDNEVSYSCTNKTYEEIDDLTWGSLRYLNGYFLYQKSCDSHYLAFSTEIPIDRIIEADVSFTHTWHGYSSSNWYTRDPVTEKVTINGDDEGGSVAYGLFGHTYSWPRIQKVSDFINDNDLTEEAENKLAGKDWVFRFYDTDYIWGSNMTGAFYEYTVVDNVTILRLEYEYNEQVYNVGIVANMGGDDGVPDNIQPPWWYFLVVIASAIISLILLIFIVPRLIIGIFDLFDVDKFSFGTIVLTILRLVVLAFLVLVVISAVKSMILGTVITDEFFGLFGVKSPIQFY